MAGGAPVPGVQLLVKWAGQQVEQTRLLIAHQGQPVLNRERERLLKTIGRSSISFSKLWGLYANHSFSMYNLYNCIFYHTKIWNRRTQMSKCFLFVWPRSREMIMLLWVHGSLLAIIICECEFTWWQCSLRKTDLKKLWLQPM